MSFKKLNELLEPMSPKLGHLLEPKETYIIKMKEEISRLLTEKWTQN